ncbi:hypothetical protein FHX44_11262 [Pseudonocardia hierapolitana]|uniref:Uncharacterized protein n=1 Tax=Pseudonocardia hierapolitana TaxID=1128676 RepID=A0A561SHU2_9PSEU|nr:hypothetical protein FHX44_11262 [Pseudonocardia hierapolitana]
MRPPVHPSDDQPVPADGHELGWAGSVVSVMSVLAQDPTGLSSPVGRLVILFGLLASLVVLLRWWWYNRRR